MDVFTTLADPTRRAMLDMLAERERAAGDFTAAFAHLSQPALSQHLKVLRQSGLVDVRPDAQRRIYTLKPERLAELDRWLARYRPLWADRLDRLEQHLDQNPE